MTLSVTDTLTGDRETFTTEDQSVFLYVCGLTVSDDPHLGHARVWVHADILHRWLAHEGYEVRHVENITDVNEKIVARVGERGADELTVAAEFTQSVLDGMRGLNLRRAEVYPRVSEHIPEIISLVETLIDQDHAYEANGSVYFDVTRFEGYGKLSNQTVDDLEAQGDPTERAEKRHPADFALWKAGGVDPEAITDHQAKHPDTAEPEAAVAGARTWESPWGEGRPGWHVECSAMSMAHLDDTIDIHMGGQDLVFPHHENEIAQSEAATGETFARYWLHVGLLATEGEKMSSSLGNFLTVEEALETYGPNVLRTFYLGAAYGSRQTFSESAMAEAEERWKRLERGHERAVAACDSVDAGTKVTDDHLRAAVDESRAAFATALDDDLNVRAATAALDELATAINRHVDDRTTYDYRGLRRAVATFEELGGEVLGLQFGTQRTGTARLAEELVELVLDVRERERAAGNYGRADDLRDALADAGVTVEDGAETTYRFD